MSQSEVARIREQIALEYEACQRMFTDPAITSRHDFIEARQANLGNCFEALSQHMTKEEAMMIFLEASEGIRYEQR